MDVQTLLLGALQNLWIAIPAFLLIITVIILVHELGHFIVARLCGVGVSVFSMGFGPEIFAFTDGHGTRWRLAWIPLGGYVKFIDDDNVASVPTTADTVAAEEKSVPPEVRASYYHSKPVWQRAAIAAAGPIANFLLAIFIYTMVFSLLGERIVPARIDQVTSGGSAARAGVQPGDVVLAIDGEAIESFSEMAVIVSSSPERTLLFTIDRKGQRLELPIAPEMKENTDLLGGKVRTGMIGIMHQGVEGETTVRYYDPASALVRGVKETQLMVAASLRGIWDILIGRQSVNQLAGPTKLVEVAGKVASFGIEPLIRLIAPISIGIGLFNLFPIPILDGGHLLFYAIEAVRGRPVSQRTQELAFRVGFALVLMLLFITTGNHFIELIGKMSSVAG